MPKKYLVPLPPIIINAIVIGFVLNHVLGVPLFITMAWVGLGQLISCYGIGIPSCSYLKDVRIRYSK